MGKFFARFNTTAIAALAVAGVMALAATAGAVSGDRNDDGIPDRWAKKHHISPKLNQAHRDQDHDHVDNLCEYESGMDPRDRNSDDDRRTDGREDSDHDGMINRVESEVNSGCDDEDSDDDGIDDGDEVSGYVSSLEDGVLKLRMVDGTILSAPLAEYVYVTCERNDFVEEPKPDEEKPEEAKPVEKESANSSQYDGEHPEAGECSEADLIPGRIVKAFYVEDGYFAKLKLLL